MKIIKAILLALALTPFGASSVLPQTYSGVASYYSTGRVTASGERFNKHAMTCAHRRFPFGTMLIVSFRGKTVECRVNDRGPFIRGRIIDLSLGSARAVGLHRHGIGRVEIRRVR